MGFEFVLTVSGVSTSANILETGFEVVFAMSGVDCRIGFEVVLFLLMVLGVGV